jgi:hypothetical protein
VQSSGLTIHISTSELNIWISHISWRACQSLQTIIISLFNLFAHDHMSEKEAKEPRFLKATREGALSERTYQTDEAFHAADRFPCFAGFYFGILITIG